MELNAEINKVFGQEMAKIFASTITEEEMEKEARWVWRELTSNKDKWGYGKDSELQRFIKQEFLSRTIEEVKKILAEPQNEEEVKKRAREMVAQARKIGEEAIISAMANKMVENTLSAYNTNEVFVRQVMEAMRLKDTDNFR